MTEKSPEGEPPEEGDEEFAIEELESDGDVAGGGAAACSWGCGYEK